MSKTLIDLLWQLKRELEKQGCERIELPVFIEDFPYRQRILRDVDADSLSPELQPLLPWLVSEKTLDIGQQVISRSVDTKVEADTNAPVAKKRGMSMVFLALGLLLVAGLGGVSLMGEKLVSDLDKTASSYAPSAGIAGSSEQVVPAVKASTAAANVKAAAEPAQPPVETEFRLHGSNTIGESLAPALLEAFWKSEGAQEVRLKAMDSDVERDLIVKTSDDEPLRRVELKAHGSSTGFKGLQSQVADLAMASRRIKDKEREALEPLYGDLASARTEHVVGMDGLAIIVHPENSLNSLTTGQLAELFSGQVKNWNELGGADVPVKVYSRDSNSGTWDSFNSMVLKKYGLSLSSDAIRLESSTELSDRVSQESGAIGFIGLPYVLRAKALAIADEAGAMPVYPTSFTISTEDYPLTRRLYIYEPMTIALDSQAHKFIEFVGSEQGQEIVRKTGFVSQNIRRIQPALSEQLPQEYLDLTQGGSRLSLNFRFKTGTFELDSKAQRDMGRVVSFFEDNPGESVVLIGFSDSVGDTEKNRELSLHRAQVVRDQLLSRGINVLGLHGMGDQVPVASNETVAGRERNRRVELWVRSGQWMPGREAAEENAVR